MLGFVLLFSACTSSPPDNSKTLAVQLANEPVSLDPALVEDGVSIRVLMNVVEGLYAYDSDGKLQPRLFDQMEVDSSHQKYSFTLKKNARWSNGTLIEEEDWIRGLKNALSPQTPAKLGELLFVIRGAREFKAGKVGWEKVGIKLSQGRLIFELKEPAPWFPHVLVLPVAFPRKEKLTNAIYRIASYERGKIIRLEKNPHHDFWKGVVAQGTPEKIDLWIVPDETTAQKLLEQGKLDVLTRISPFELKRLKTRVRVQAYPILATYYIGLNVRDPWFKNPVVRRAFAASIQKDEIVQAIGGSDLPAKGWIPEGLEGYQEYEQTSSAERTRLCNEAKKILARSSPKTPMTLIYDQSSINQIVLEKIQQDIKKHLGISVKLQAADWKTHVRNIRSFQGSGFRFGWLSPFIDPVAHLKAFTKESVNNFTGWSNPQFDAWIDQVSRLSPGSTRRDAILKAQKMLLEDEAVVVPVFHYRLNHAFSARVKQAKVNPLSVLLFNEVRIGSSE